MPRTSPPLTPKALLDLSFLDARSKLLDIAAFLDRLDRAGRGDDFRLAAFKAAIRELDGRKPERAQRILTLLSDRTSRPIPQADSKGAIGAVPPPTRSRAPKQPRAKVRSGGLR